MGLLLVFIAMIAFAIQGVLFTKYVRKYSATQVAYIRNISMIFTGFPVLFFVKDFSWALITANLPWIIITAVFGAFHVLISYIGYESLPVGIHQIIKNGSKTIMVLILSLVFLKEGFAGKEVVALFLIVGGSFLLLFGKVDTRHLPKAHIGKGLFSTILAGILSALARYFFLFYATELGAVLGAYVLEASIGCLFIIPVLFSKKGGSSSERISVKDVLYISSIGIITYIGTVCLSFAFQYDGFGLISLLRNVGIVVSLIFAYFLFGEKITRKQGIIIIVILIGIILLKL